VITLVFLGLMKDPVLIKVVAGSQCAKTQDSLGASEAPAGTCNFHAVFDQVPTSTFDNSCGDGKPLGKVMIVLEVGCIAEQVVGAGIHAVSFCRREISPCGTTAHAPCHPPGLSPQYFKEPDPNPAFQLRPRLGVKRPSYPQRQEGRLGTPCKVLAPFSVPTLQAHGNGDPGPVFPARAGKEACGVRGPLFFSAGASPCATLFITVLHSAVKP